MLHKNRCAYKILKNAVLNVLLLGVELLSNILVLFSIFGKSLCIERVAILLIILLILSQISNRKIEDKHLH